MDRIKVIINEKEYSFEKGATIKQIFENLGIEAIAAKLNDEAVDLSTKVNKDSKIEPITFDSELGRSIFFHSSAHLLAYATKRLFNVKLGIGPAIAEGFFYDFLSEKSFSQEDLERIEKEMKSLASKDLKFERIEVSYEEAKKILSNEPFKLELLEEHKNEKISFYKLGDFIDLCKGPHIYSTSLIKEIKLLSTSTAYWKGNEKNPMLQRIYGISFPKEGMLEKYLKQEEEKKERDHRIIGKELGLFYINELVGSGLIMYPEEGAMLLQILKDFELKEHLKRGYKLVSTPHIARAELWKVSGHYDYYKEHMFLFKIEDEEYGIKAMNCPFHILIFKRKTRSYKELPIRYFEFGSVYRNELSGTLTGLFRVRGFTQDDAHIFCTQEQVKDEIKNLLDFLDFLMKKFDLNYSIKISTMPEKALGTKEQWEKATQALIEAVKEKGKSFEIRAKEGAFYGPKIDVLINDVYGNEWQGPTIQFDFNLPERFDVSYIDKDGRKKRVVMIHRALFGSLERMLGILIEHYKGDFPLWLSPIQLQLIPISKEYEPFAFELERNLKEKNVRVEVDIGEETINKKILEASKRKIPYVMLLGKKEKEEKVFTLRRKDGKFIKGSFEEILKVFEA
ncbi:MAG: threonine--tRNA ligase [Candidatus Micrarchaeia archaeon]